jgi:hypothetical protein
MTIFDGARSNTRPSDPARGRRSSLIEHFRHRAGARRLELAARSAFRGRLNGFAPDARRRKIERASGFGESMLAHGVPPARRTHTVGKSSELRVLEKACWLTECPPARRTRAVGKSSEQAVLRESVLTHGAPPARRTRRRKIERAAVLGESVLTHGVPPASRRKIGRAAGLGESMLTHGAPPARSNEKPNTTDGRTRQGSRSVVVSPATCAM